MALSCSSWTPDGKWQAHLTVQIARQPAVPPGIALEAHDNNPLPASLLPDANAQSAPAGDAATCKGTSFCFCETYVPKGIFVININGDIQVRKKLRDLEMQPVRTRVICILSAKEF